MGKVPAAAAARLNLSPWACIPAIAMIDILRLTRAASAFVRSCRQQDRQQRRFQTHRRLIGALCVAGIADSAYLYLYQSGTIRHLHCPFLGEGCEKISGSKTAHPLGIPDAVFGIAGYSAMLMLTQRGERARSRTQPMLPILAFATGSAALGASLSLNWRQWAEFHTFCFWHLTSAALASVIFPLTLPEARVAWEHVQAQGRRHEALSEREGAAGREAA